MYVSENSWFAGAGARDEEGVIASSPLAALDCIWSRGRRLAGSKVCLRSSDDTSQGLANCQPIATADVRSVREGSFGNFSAGQGIETWLRSGSGAAEDGPDSRAAYRSHSCVRVRLLK